MSGTTLEPGSGGAERMLRYAAERVDAYWKLIRQKRARSGALFVALCALARRIDDDADWARDSGLLLHFGVVR